MTNNSNAVPILLDQTDNRAEEDDENQEPLMSDIVLLEHELELLHISRQDNPYLQLLTSQDNLDKDYADSSTFSPTSSTFSPEPPRSPGNRSSYGGMGMYTSLHLHHFNKLSKLYLLREYKYMITLNSYIVGGGTTTPLMLEDIHSHLVRSPPPVAWPPLSPRSLAGPFSPDSGSDGNDFESKHHHRMGNNRMTGIRPGRTFSPPNVKENRYDMTEIVNRSHSEEHILSPSRDVKKKEVFSPARGATPDYLNGRFINLGTISFGIFEVFAL